MIAKKYCLFLVALSVTALIVISANKYIPELLYKGRGYNSDEYSPKQNKLKAIALTTSNGGGASLMLSLSLSTHHNLRKRRESVYWRLRAACLLNPFAMFLMAERLWSGCDGIEKDRCMALLWYKRSSSMGCKPAMHCLLRIIKSHEHICKDINLSPYDRFTTIDDYIEYSVNYLRPKVRNASSPEIPMALLRLLKEHPKYIMEDIEISKLHDKIIELGGDPFNANPFRSPLSSPPPR